MIHAILYLVALVAGTLWYGGKVIVAAIFRVPHGPDSVYEHSAKSWARLLLAAAGVTVSIEGVEHVSRTEAQIIIANHQSWFDILAVFVAVPVEVRFVAKKELFAIPFFGWALMALEHVKLDRGNLKQAITAYETAARYIAERKLSVLVFPEGTRSRDGKLQPFKAGPFILAIQSGAPVVPAYVAGTFGILPKGSIRVRPHAVRVYFGAPIVTRGMTLEHREVLRDRARTEVAQLRAGSVDADLDHS